MGGLQVRENCGTVLLVWTTRLEDENFPHHSSFTSNIEAINLPYGDWLKAGGRHRVDEPRANESSQVARHECGGGGTSSRSSPNLGNPNRLTGTTDTNTGYAADIVDEIG